VSILGSEGKGKSTVLNAIFGASFNVPPRERMELTRTTNGVDVSIVNELILLDVEGFDSSSRQVASLEEVKGERNIEDKLALFVLLATDIVIINLMVSDCGTYQASGMKTLETIFKATKQLHQEQRLRSKKKIMFFVRDVGSQTIKAITATIIRRLTEVIERTGLTESEIYGLIDIGILPFPHYDYCRCEFLAQAQDVKPLFSHQQLLSEFPGVSANLIPGVYQVIWEAVLTNETMNLPDINSVMNSLHLRDVEISNLENEVDRRRQSEEIKERQWQSVMEKERQKQTELELEIHKLKRTQQVGGFLKVLGGVLLGGVIGLGTVVIGGPIAIAAGTLALGEVVFLGVSAAALGGTVGGITVSATDKK
jgi:hypothetical protein